MCRHRFISSVRAWGVAVTLLVPVANSAQRPAIPTAPATPRHDTADTLFGTRVADPYRWLERFSDPEVRAWYEAESKAAEAVLMSSPAYAASLRDFAAARRSRRYTSLPLTTVGGRQFFTRQQPTEPTASLWVLEQNGRERRVFDVSQVVTDSTTPAAFAGAVPSHDGRYVVVQYVLNGDERVLARVVDVASGQLLDGPFATGGMQFGPISGAVRWTADSRAFWYVPRRDLEAGATNTRLFGGMPLRLHQLGTPLAGDPVVFDPSAHGGDSTTVVRLIELSADALVLSLETEANTQAANVWLVPDSLARRDRAPWRQVATMADSIRFPMVRRRWLYGIGSRGAPNGQLVRTPLDTPDWSHAEVVVRENGGVMWEWTWGQYAAAADAFYYVLADSGRSRLMRAPFEGAPASDVPAPFDGSVGPLITDPRRPGVVFSFGGWTVGDRMYRFAPGLARMTLLPARFNPPNPYASLRGLTVEQVFATASDGVRVPMTILRGPSPRGIARGPRPAVVEGYGAYGNTIDAYFRPELRPWLAAGGVWVFCHTRGGGYFGRRWREDGALAKKPNTWRDAIACGESLVTRGITTSAQLGITGASAGGILAGRAITERPDLFGAAAIMVGVSDMVRFEFSGAGPSNVDEFGSVKTEPGFRALLAMSPYHQVQSPEANVRYPATMLYAGFNDRRVLPWHPAKLSAALRHAGGASAAPDGSRPVILFTDFGAGHGGGVTTSSADQRRAAVVTWFAMRLGLPLR